MIYAVSALITALPFAGCEIRHSSFYIVAETDILSQTDNGCQEHRKQVMNDMKCHSNGIFEQKQMGILCICSKTMFDDYR